MSHRGPIIRILSVMLVVTVPLVFVPQVSGQETATLAGTVYALDGKQPLDGAVLHAGDIRSGEIYSSAATNDDGGFVLAGLPPAAYRLAVETEAGLYVVGTPLPLAPGQERDVQLALKTGAAADPESANKEAQGGRFSFLDNPLFAAFSVIGAAVLFGYLISEIDDDDQGIASPIFP